MRRLLLIFLMIPLMVFSQNFELKKSTEQTINHGAAPISTTNYLILLKKSKSFKWSVDSIYSIADNKKVNYNIVTVNDPSLTSPDYKPLNSFEKKFKGFIQITFAKTLSRGAGGRPNAPQVNSEEQNDFSKGIIIYYTIKKKKKEMKIELFEKIETIDAP